MRKKLFKDIHPELAQSLSKMAKCCDQLGEHKKALTFYKEAYLMGLKLFDESHPEIVSVLNGINNCTDKITEK